MRLLLDEQLPRTLTSELTSHDVRTVQSQGWRGLADKTLLALASEAGFEVFVIADRGIEFEQNLAANDIAIVMLVVPSNRLEHLKPLMAQVNAALGELEPGQLLKIGPSADSRG